MAKIRLTDAEFAVLEPLWREGPQTIRQLTAQIYPGQSTSDYATVQKLLERLEAKRCVKRDRSALAHVFRATIARERLIDEQLQQIADRLCDGSLVPVLNQLVRQVPLSRDELAELKELLDSHPKRPPAERKS
jgi:BlaI family transcriptional regulator, penicillinase repressor